MEEENVQKLNFFQFWAFYRTWKPYFGKFSFCQISLKKFLFSPKARLFEYALSLICFAGGYT